MNENELKKLNKKLDIIIKAMLAGMVFSLLLYKLFNKKYIFGMIACFAALAGALTMAIIMKTIIIKEKELEKCLSFIKALYYMIIALFTFIAFYLAGNAFVSSILNAAIFLVSVMELLSNYISYLKSHKKDVDAIDKNAPMDEQGNGVVYCGGGTEKELLDEKKGRVGMIENRGMQNAEKNTQDILGGLSNRIRAEKDPEIL